jgi:hypothetical protein
MKVRIVNLTAPLLLGLIAAICYAQDFSADIAYRPVKTRDGDSQPAPVMVSFQDLCE